MKNCSNKNCKQINPQPLENFSKGRSNQDGLQYLCKDCKNQKDKEYRLKPENREKHNKRRKQRINSSEFRINQTKFQQENKYKLCKKCGLNKPLFEFGRRNADKTGLDSWCKGCKIIYSLNKEVKDKINKRRREREQTDIQYKIKHCLRSRLNFAIKSKQKLGSAVEDLQCSIDYFMDIYIPSLWAEGMTWTNHGNKPSQWSIDHYIPLSAFDLTDREQFLKACHYTNLRPMWHLDNVKKRDEIPHEKMGEYLEFMAKFKQEIKE